MANSAIALLPYQQKSFLDRSRFKALFWARGCRKSFTSTLEIVDDCHEVEASGARTTWILVSRGDRQALELLSEAKRHCKAYSMAASEITEIEIWSENLQKTVKGREITLPRGSRILSLPPVADTLRGYTSNIYLDEYDILSIDTQEELWRAAFPVLRGTRRMIISSTGKHLGSRFHRIVTGNEDGIWSIHKVDIFEAVKQGLPFDIEFERKALADEDGWKQEYCLEFIADASAWLDYTLIASCEAEIEPTQDRNPVYVGWDVARYQDLSVIWIVKQLADIFVTQEIVTMKAKSFSEQRQEFDRIMKTYNPRRVCVDSTGLGMILAEQLQQSYGQFRIEAVNFSNSVKQDLAILIKKTFEDRKVRIPSDNVIRESLHGVKKTVTTSGATRFDGERTEQGGHQDFFWSLSLALYAADGGSVHVEYETVAKNQTQNVIDDFGNYDLTGFC